MDIASMCQAAIPHVHHPNTAAVIITTTPSAAVTPTFIEADDTTWINHYLADIAARIRNAKAELTHCMKQVKKLREDDLRAEQYRRMIRNWRTRLADLREKRAVWSVQLTDVVKAGEQEVHSATTLET